MSLFNSTNFEQQGNTKDDLKLQCTEDISNETLKQSATALQSIKIFTPDLEPSLYNNEAFRKILLNFVRGNRHAKIQVLAADTTSAVQYGHHLIRLSQQITSSMQLRITSEEYATTGISFLLIDQSTFIFKVDNNKNNALASSCKNRMNKLLDFFNRSWEQAPQDPQTKRLSI